MPIHWDFGTFLGLLGVLLILVQLHLQSESAREIGAHATEIKRLLRRLINRH